MTITTPPTRTRAPQPGRTQPGKAPTKAQPGRTRSAPSDTVAARTRSAASQRAYARRAQRQAILTGRAAVAKRAPFVLVVMALLAAGLVTSLWLSTAASADSYRLEQARQQARDLSERSEQLRQEVANLQTAPQLAEHARRLGMVPSGEPAVLVVQPDGTVVVVGEPAPATAPAPPVPPAPAVPPGATTGTATDPATGLPIDPATGLPVNPAVDPATGQPVDPAAGQQPPAGQPVDPAAGQQPPPAGGG